MSSPKSAKKMILIGVGSLLLFIGIYWLFDHWTHVYTDNAQIEAPSLLLAPKVSGYIQKVLVQEGQYVKQGELLIQIEDRDYRAQLTTALSERTSLEARKRDLERSFHRAKELMSKQAITQQQMDSAEASFFEIKAKYDAASARVAQAELNLEWTQIKAPSNGAIAKKSAEIGQLASPGTPLIGFVGSDSRWIVANFKETQVEDIHVGQKAIVRVDALPGIKFHAEIESLSSATGATFSLLPPDNATGNFTKVVQRIPVRLKFTNLTKEQLNKLSAGLSADVSVSIR